MQIGARTDTSHICSDYKKDTEVRDRNLCWSQWDFAQKL